MSKEKPESGSPIFGKTLGDPLVFRKVKNREKIEVERK